MFRIPLTAFLVVSLCAATVAGCGGAEGQSETVPRSVQAAPAQLPAPTAGARAAAPGVPTSKDGDNSIQTWGLEGTRAERAAGSAVVRSYLRARADRNWAKVCELLSTKARTEQGRIVDSLPCAKATAILSQASGRRLAEEAKIVVLSFRIGGGYAFLIYRRTDGVFAIGLARQDGKWKVVSATPNPLS